MLWEVDIYPAPGQPDLLGRPISTAAAELGLAADLKVAAARGYLIQADWDRGQAERVALNCSPTGSSNGRSWRWWVMQNCNRFPSQSTEAQFGRVRLLDQFRDAQLIHVLPKPGVMDPVAQSVMSAIEDFGLKAEVVRTLKKYWIEGLDPDRVGTLSAQKSWPTTPSSR